MKKMLELPKKAWPIAVILAISLLASWRWIGISIFSNGDWSFHFSESLKGLVSLNFPWTASSNLGSINLTASSWPSMFLFGISGFLNQNSNVADKFVFMFPVILLPGITSYVLLKKILNSTPAALAGSLVFTYNTYFLILKTSQLTVLVAEFLAPLLILLFIKSLEERKVFNIVATSLLALLIGAYEFRILYVIGAVLFFYFTFHLFIIEKGRYKSNLKSLAIAFFTLLIVGFLNSYWIIGLSKSGSVLHNAIFDRGLFGSQYLNLSQSFAIFHPFWNGTEPIGFLVNPIPLYFWIVPILAFTGLALNRKNPKVIFFGLVALLGLLLTKQEDAPFSHLYLWLYQHFPGFNAFREASKFYLLIALGYSVLIGALIKWVWEHAPQQKNIQNHLWKAGKYGLAIGISCLFLWNIKPFVTGEIGTLFIPRTIPNDYVIVKNLILNQPNYFRTYWIPASPRWSIYTNSHPRISGVDISSGDWQELSSSNNGRLSSNQRIVDVLKSQYAKNLLNQAAVKYIIVPLRDEANEDDFFIYYGDDRQFYIDTLNSLPFLKRIDIGTKDLAVYENTDFKPYISSPANLYQLPTTQDLPPTYSFVSSQLAERDFNFITTDTTKNVPTTSITDAFSNLGLKDFQPGTITRSFNLTSPTLFTNINKPALSYQVTSGCNAPAKPAKAKIAPKCTPESTLTISADNKNLVSVGSQPLPGTGDVKTTALSKKLTAGKTYLLGIGQTPVSIDTSGAVKNLGTVSDDSHLFSIDSPNLIPNPSLESGLWQKSISDCNNYDDRALISMSLDTQDSTEGSNSLRLDADQHTACTGPSPITVKAGDPYLLNFDYEVKNTKEIAYEIDFDDSKKTVIKEFVNDPDESWRNFQKMITVPPGATHLTLLVYGIPDERRQNHATTHYDNFLLSHLNLESPLNLNTNPIFSKLSLNSSSQLLTYTDQAYNYQNLITNPSLESGLWKKTVGDCNAYDGNPILGMKLDTQDSTDGHNSLELQAQRHNACTGPDPITVKENQTYRLSFDYSSPNSTGANYYLSFDDAPHTAVTENLPIKDSSWHAATKYFRVPPGATHLNLVVYSYADAYGSTNIITRYDNFSILEIPDIQGRYFLVSAPTQPLTPPASITYDSGSPTLKYVHVTGAKTPFYVAMSEAYHDGWRLELNNSQVNGRLRGWIPWVHPNAVADAQHVKLNDFENGWYVDPSQFCQDNPSGCVKNSDGSYDLQMQIEFVPQRWFYLGTLISAVTLAGCLLYLIIYALTRLFRRPRKPKPPTKEAPPSSLSTYWTQLHSTKQ